AGEPREDLRSSSLPLGPAAKLLLQPIEERLVEGRHALRLLRIPGLFSRVEALPQTIQLLGRAQIGRVQLFGCAVLVTQGLPLLLPIAEILRRRADLIAHLVQVPTLPRGELVHPGAELDREAVEGANDFRQFSLKSCKPILLLAEQRVLRGDLLFVAFEAL